MRLCLTLGCTVSELNQRMSTAELQDWWVWYCTEPWGEERADMRTAMQTSILVNLWLDPKAKRTTPNDFMPQFYGRPQGVAAPRQSAREMLNLLRAGTRQVGGRQTGGEGATSL